MSKAAALLIVLFLAASAFGAALGTAARSTIPADVQQIISVDYRNLKNSSTAMALKEKVLPDSLRKFETALRGFGLEPDRDVDQLAFISFRSGNELRILGVAQGTFPTQAMVRRMTVRGVKPVRYRDMRLYPTSAGLQVAFLDASTMLFGDSGAMRIALDARDGDTPSLNSNDRITDLMSGVDSGTVWSVLDSTGTQNMMRGALGDAARLADFETVKKRLLGSRYTMEFQNGVNFNLDVFTPDSFTAAGLSSLVRAGMLYRRLNASDVEKSVMESLSVDNDADKLRLRFRADDRRFQSFLRTDLFAAVSR